MKYLRDQRFYRSFNPYNSYTKCLSCVKETLTITSLTLMMDSAHTTLLWVAISVPAQNGLIPPETSIIRTTWLSLNMKRTILDSMKVEEKYKNCWKKKRTILDSLKVEDEYPQAPHVWGWTCKSTLHHLMGWKGVFSFDEIVLKKDLAQFVLLHISGYLWCHELQSANHGAFHLVHPTQLTSKPKIYQSVRETYLRRVKIKMPFGL